MTNLKPDTILFAQVADTLKLNTTRKRMNYITTYYAFSLFSLQVQVHHNEQ